MKRVYLNLAAVALACAAVPAEARPWHHYHDGFYAGYSSWDYPGPAYPCPVIVRETPVIVHETIVRDVPPPAVIVEEAPPPVIVHEVPVPPPPVIIRNVPPQDVIVTERTAATISDANRHVITSHLKHRHGRKAVHHNYEVGRQLSAHYMTQVVPDEVLELLDPVPQGYRYVRIDDDVLLLSARGNVADVVRLP